MRKLLALFTLLVFLPVAVLASGGDHSALWAQM